MANQKEKKESSTLKKVVVSTLFIVGAGLIIKSLTKDKKDKK